MFGNNPVRKYDPETGTMLRVQEIFPTIQGEGPFAGVPAVFIRLAGCNLRCYFCDTDFESNYENKSMLFGIYEDVERLMLKSKGPGLIVVSGGEPFRQELCPLLSLLTSELGAHVQIETAGTLWGHSYDLLSYMTAVGPMEGGKVSIVVSPKTAVVSPAIASRALAWKYIVSSDNTSADDGLPILSTQIKGQSCKLARPPASIPSDTIYIQPMDVPDAAERKANMEAAIEICKRFGYRLSLQQHKVVGLP